MRAASRTHDCKQRQNKWVNGDLLLLWSCNLRQPGTQVSCDRTCHTWEGKRTTRWLSTRTRGRLELCSSTRSSLRFLHRLVLFFFFFINTRPKSKSPRPNSGRVSPSYRSDPIPLGQGQACGTRTGKRKMGTSRFLRNRIHGWRHASKRPFSGPRGTKNHAGVPGMWATA